MLGFHSDSLALFRPQHQTRFRAFFHKIELLKVTDGYWIPNLMLVSIIEYLLFAMNNFKQTFLTKKYSILQLLSKRRRAVKAVNDLLCFYSKHTFACQRFNGCLMEAGKGKV